MIIKVMEHPDYFPLLLTWRCVFLLEVRYCTMRCLLLLTWGQRFRKQMCRFISECNVGNDLCSLSLKTHTHTHGRKIGMSIVYCSYVKCLSLSLFRCHGPGVTFPNVMMKVSPKHCVSVYSHRWWQEAWVMWPVAYTFLDHVFFPARVCAYDYFAFYD